MALLQREAVLLFLLALCCARATPVGTLWRLPLGIGANDNTGELAIAGDDTTLYTADIRGTIFAIEAKTGRVRWSNPGSGALEQLFVFPSVPELVYYTSSTSFDQFSLRALRREDGAEVAVLRNLSLNSESGTYGAKVVATGYGLAILHDYGLYSTDAYLNVQWAVDNPPGEPLSGAWFTHLAATENLILTFRRTSDPLSGNGISFDAQSGNVVCNISDLSTVFLTLGKIPFVLSNDGWSFLYEMSTNQSSGQLFGAAVDFQRCGVQRTTRTSNAAIADGVTILSPTNYSDPSQSTLFFSFSVPNSSIGNWTITRSRLGFNDTIWNLTLPANPIGFGMPPLVTKAFGIPDALVLWYLGTFLAVDLATGSLRWSLAPAAVPTSPPQFATDPYTIFPLGDGGRLFVPNLQGYTVLESYTGDVLEVTFAEPILATQHFHDVDNDSTYAVYVNAFGDVVGVA